MFRTTKSPKKNVNIENIKLFDTSKHSGLKWGDLSVFGLYGVGAIRCDSET